MPIPHHLRQAPCIARALLPLTLAVGLGPAVAAGVQVQAQGAGGQPLADVVLLLEPQGAKAAVKPVSEIEIVQEGRRFVPAVTVVPVGTKVQFPNRDSVRHHVYSFSPARKFELRLYVGKPANPVEFDRAGVVVLGCNIHDAMVGWVIVSDTPWYAKTPASGQASLADVPTGAYVLRAWHPDLPAGSNGVEQPVTVGTSALALSVRLPVVGR
ncbi:MAG: methylamine utilization protein [Vitreoscilla sp.]|nr:methylamine utilization protein [Vitreoscilla sp.]